MSNEVLNQAVADLSQMSALIHQTHWYMRGSGFLSLHPKMDELRDAVEAQLDEVAERLIIIGGAPYSTLTEFATHSKINLETTTYDVALKTRLSAVLEAFKYLSESFDTGIRALDDDHVSQDIFIGAKAYFDKMVWMLEAELS